MARHQLIRLAGAAAVALAVAACGSSSTPSAAPATAVGFQVHGHPVYGQLGPEGIPVETGPTLAPVSSSVTGQTVADIGCNGAEQLAYHHHAHLIVFVHGAARSLPLAIGIMPQVGVAQTPEGEFAESSSHCFYWLHVHAVDGILHIEAPSATTFTLGQFFAVYGQPLSSSQVAGNTGAVTATVNGVRYAGDPAAIPLDEHTQIVLNVGGPVVVPPAIDWSSSKL